MKLRFMSEPGERSDSRCWKGLVRVIGMVAMGLASEGALGALGALSGGGSGQVTVGWNANEEEDVVGYRVHVGIRSGEYSSTIDVGNVTETQVKGLQPGVVYYVMVTAYNTRELESLPSEEIAVVPRVPEPEVKVDPLTSLPVGEQPWRQGAPRIAERQPLPTGGYAFTVLGAAGQTLNVYVTEDMLNWRLLTSTSNPTGMVRVQDLEARLTRQRYYQVLPE